MLPLDENGGFEMTGTNRIARQTFGAKKVSLAGIVSAFRTFSVIYSKCSIPVPNRLVNRPKALFVPN